MAVLKTTSPAMCPSIPIAVPRKILPSARANRAAFFNSASASFVSVRRRKREGSRGTFPFQVRLVKPQKSGANCTGSTAGLSTAIIVEPPGFRSAIAPALLYHLHPCRRALHPGYTRPAACRSPDGGAQRRNPGIPLYPSQSVARMKALSAAIREDPCPEQTVARMEAQGAAIRGHSPNVLPGNSSPPAQSSCNNPCLTYR